MMRKKIDIRHLAAALLAALMLLACLPVTQADAAGNTIHISSEAELRNLLSLEHRMEKQDKRPRRTKSVTKQPDVR